MQVRDAMTLGTPRRGKERRDAAFGSKRGKSGRTHRISKVRTAFFLFLLLMLPQIQWAPAPVSANGEVPRSHLVAYDFVARAHEATWRDSDGDLPFPGPFPVSGTDTDGRGLVLRRYSVLLEDGHIWDRVLETHPHPVIGGWIQGSYPYPDTVPHDAKLMVTMGFLAGATGTDGVTFQVHFISTADIWTHLVSIRMTYDNMLGSQVIDLEDLGLGGLSGRFCLTVLPGEDAEEDWAVWAQAYVFVDLSGAPGPVLGDLALVSVEPVQVLYGALLVKGKGTAFRVLVHSTFEGPVEADLRLILPDDEWSKTPPWPWGIRETLPAGWRFPEDWGPVFFFPGDNEIMLPIVRAGEEDEVFDANRYPAGMLEGICITSETCYPPIRNLPRPIVAHRGSGPGQPGVVGRRASVRVLLDPDHQVTEASEANNDFYELHNVWTTGSMKLIYVGHAWNMTQFFERANERWQAGYIGLAGTTLYPWDRLDEYAKEQTEYLLGVYPVADSKISYIQLHAPLYLRENYVSRYVGESGCWDSAIGHEKGCNPCFLALMRDMMVPLYPDAHAVALVQAWGCCGCTHPVCTPPVFYVEDDLGPDPNVAHELSHCDMRFPTGGLSPDCYACDWCETGAPGCRYHGTLSCESCNSDEGFWANEWREYEYSNGMNTFYMDCVRSPDVVWSKLGPTETCRGEASHDGYLNLLLNFLALTDPEAVLVRGTVTKTGKATLKPLIRLANATIDLRDGTLGEYYVVTSDERNVVLGKYGFTPIFEMSRDPEGLVETETFLFSYRIEWKEGTKKIELQDKNGSVLGSREVSANKPEVRLVQPKGGEVWERGKNYTIKWEASDRDGDPLTFSIAMSMNGGETWFPVDIDVVGDEYSLDTLLLPEGQQYLVRVQASDGASAAEDVSDEAFSITPPATATTTTQPTTTQETTPTVTSTPPVGPQCIIATTAYGSEMADELAYMRYVRDNMIGSNDVGRMLVEAWNAFYYSWSPPVARLISANPQLRPIFGGALLPIVGIVHGVAYVYSSLAPFSSPFASVMGFLFACVSSLAVYVLLPSFILRIIYRRKLKIGSG